MFLHNLYRGFKKINCVFVDVFNWYISTSYENHSINTNLTIVASTNTSLDEDYQCISHVYQDMMLKLLGH